MIKWTKNRRALRAMLFLAAIGSFAITSGAGTRWGLVISPWDRLF